MNVFSRALICALLLGGTTQPMDWKYIVPCVAATCFGGGCIALAVQSKQNKEKIAQLTKSNNDKDTTIGQLTQDNDEKKEKIELLTKGINDKDVRIWELESETGSIKRKKDSKKGIYKDQEEISLLQKDLAIKNKDLAAKNGIIKNLQEKWDKFYTNYFHLMTAMDEELLSDKKYVVDVVQLNPKASLGVLINNKIYYLIEDSKFYLPSEIYTDATIGLWRSQRGQTISKGTAGEIRLAAPPEPSNLPLPPERKAPALTSETFIPPSPSSPSANTSEDQRKYNRLSKATIANEIQDLFKKVAEFNQVSNSNNG